MYSVRTRNVSVLAGAAYWPHLQAWLAIWCCACVVGCTLRPNRTCQFDSHVNCDELCKGPGAPQQLEITEPAQACICDESIDVLPSPEQIGEGAEVTYYDIGLQQMVAIALENSKVLRDLGGNIIRQPDNVRTVHDPAATYTDPRFGVEAALSAFDASLGASALFEKNDRAFNNTFIGTGGLLRQDLANYTTELRKRAATGTQLAARHVTDYSFDNVLGNRFGNPSTAWTTYFEAEARQPLLQGGGVTFNRIAGPGRDPGVINGVLLARIRTDITLDEFEEGVRNLVSNVENAYWDLYFAYRDLDAKIHARDSALRLWHAVKANEAAGAARGTAEIEGQAREQYWRFESEVVDSLHGRLFDATQTNNGSIGGTFRGNGGVRVAERRLRLIAGLPVNGHQLLRPIEDPTVAPLKFDWDMASAESLQRRTELRRQRWRVKQRELELLANRNFLLPQLDAVARYRTRGLGQELISQSDQRFSSAFGDLKTGDFQEWQLGVELNMPLGFRRAHAALRNSEHLVAREAAILKEQKRDVLFGLSNAIVEVKRSYESIERQYNRRVAANATVNTLQEQYKQGIGDLDVLLEAQRRVADADIAYFRARSEYAVALKNVHFEKGSLLPYYNIVLNESASPGEAYCDLQCERVVQPRSLNYVCRDVTVSQGAATSNVPLDAVNGAIPLPPGQIIGSEIPTPSSPPTEIVAPPDVQK